MKRLAIIGCMAALGVFAEVPEDWTGTTHDLTTGALTAADGGAYWVTGSGNVITVPANVTCTVPSTQADLSTTLKAAPLRHYTGRVEKDAETHASEGLVTYTATWTKTGFTAIIR